VTHRTDISWPELIAERRKAKQEAEAAEKEPTIEEKINAAAERVHRRGATTKPRTARHVRDPDKGLARFHELVAESKKK
jgi:hypothetical protein